MATITANACAVADGFTGALLSMLRHRARRELGQDGVALVTELVDQTDTRRVVAVRGEVLEETEEDHRHVGRRHPRLGWRPDRVRALLDLRLLGPGRVEGSARAAAAIPGEQRGPLPPIDLVAHRLQKLDL